MARPAAAAPPQDLLEVKPAVARDVSAPLSLLRPAPDAPFAEHEPRGVRAFKDRAPILPDAVLQSSTPPLLVPAPLTAFPGIGDGFQGMGASRSFSVGGFPPDTDGDVGPNHYVQIVNTSFAVFDKTGRLLWGAVPTNTLWSGFGGACESHRDGDGVVLYDGLADRWFITQFAVRDTGPWFQCVAVSVSGDPTGQYYRYAYQYDGFNDYGKFGVWPDAYYATYNSFDANRVYRGAVICAFDRISMLQGLPAAEQCFKLFQSNGPLLSDGSNLLYGNILPADLDGQNPPPLGAPGFMLSFDSGNLQLWKFHVDWLNPARTTLTGSAGCDATRCPPIAIPVDPYTPLCYEPASQILADGGPGLPDGGPPTEGTCIPQKGGTLPLDSLADRPMFRAAYRNFADHESLLLNHSVRAGAGGGVRWYELRAPNANAPVVYQSGTYAPDADYRWLGSMAMDSAGNIALAYSRSGIGLYPGISFTARNASDAAGQMSLGEAQITAGTGAQNVAGQAKAAVRWGDYSNLSIDPSDDCTFWYTNEYIPSGSFWRTTISSFQLPSCQLFTPVLSPRSAALERGGKPASFSFTVVPGKGVSGPFDLSVGGLPAGVSASLSTTTIDAGQTAVLTLAAQPGPVTLRGAQIGVAATLRTNNQARYQLLTFDVLGNEFSVSPSPASVVVSAGTSKQVTLQTRAVHGAADAIAFAIEEALPRGLTASFNPASVSAGGASLLTLTAAPDAPPQSATLAIRASSPNSTHVTGILQTTLSLPTASLDAPAVGTRLVGSKTFTLSGAASAGTTLVGLELLSDGRPVGSAAPGSPSTLTVDTTRIGNGTHLFSARATDANGGRAESLAVSMMVDNPAGCGCSGAGGGVDAAGLFVALSFALRRASARRPSGSPRRGRRSRPGRPA